MKQLHHRNSWVGKSGYSQKSEILAWIGVADMFKDTMLAWDISELVNRKLIVISWDDRYKERDVIGFCGDQIGKQIFLNIVGPDITRAVPD